ncbi:MAG: 3-hydroxybutyryl-CoA dehydrogenase [Saprospiraceae bacterium]|nr:3-hydroxybutyryl-CoA dehydrogenase [Saprospiraceae bacterium]MBP7699907.1 3-hydroxybutyryl-CoA dehydrogenase [Saprospiraceae bacterium]
MNVGIIGSGTMGSGIAQVAAMAGCMVILCDTNTAALKKAAQQMQNTFTKLIEKGKITHEQATQFTQAISFQSDSAACVVCDIVIEAIVEDLSIKKHLFAQLETIVRADCILATNTSSLSVTAIAGGCQQPERVIGIHFFNPAPLMQLVEIIPAIQTTTEVLDSAKKLITSWHKIIVVAKDTPGFIVNRIARPFYSEALRILEEGIADVSTIDYAMTTIGNFRMGPFALMDFIGNDVNFAVTQSVYESFFYEPRYRPAFTQKRLVEAGWLGKKSGKGYYTYAADAPTQHPDTNDILLRKIADRIVIMLINEAADAHYYNIATKNDIELAMTKGVNYPKGLLQWAEELGYKNCVNKMDALYEYYHEDRYRCSVGLRQLAQRQIVTV